MCKPISLPAMMQYENPYERAPGSQAIAEGVIIDFCTKDRASRSSTRVAHSIGQSSTTTVFGVAADHL